MDCWYSCISSGIGQHDRRSILDRLHRDNDCLFWMMPHHDSKTSNALWMAVICCWIYLCI